MQSSRRPASPMAPPLVSWSQTRAICPRSVHGLAFGTGAIAQCRPLSQQSSDLLRRIGPSTPTLNSFRPPLRHSPSHSLLTSSGPTGLFVPRRLLFADRKLDRAVEISEDGDNRFNPRRQHDLYKELIRSNLHFEVVQRYENQPQLPPTSASYPPAARAADVFRIQQDPDCIRDYVAALIRDGRTDQIAERLRSLMVASAPSPSSTSQSQSFDSGPRSANNYSSFSQSRSRRAPPDSRDYFIRTDPGAWQSAFQARGMPPPPIPSSAPIPVSISEAWSWSKLTRQLVSNVLYAVLLMTGLSVILDQQGIMKSGLGANGEVEPLTQATVVRFADVQGVDEAKAELEEVVEYLRDPGRFTKVGGKLPKGVLLYGPPGTGKTHLARAVAGEAGVPFFQMSGSEFDELYVGVGARRVRELFAAAKKRAPCIVFIDELDAVGSKRSSKDQSYMRQTLNQLLVELDGFSPNEGVIFIAATNTPESLDRALVRPGRFDRHVPVPLPDVVGRTQILKVHMRSIAVSPQLDPQTIAKGTPGFSGADLANLVNQAAVRASKRGGGLVGLEDLEWAKDKIIMGAERRSAVITEQAKRLTAYHEGGHALVALYTPAAMPLHKVTVIPRGVALGVTVQLPEGDRNTSTLRELLATMDVCMGGRAAEEVVFGRMEMTTGASSDLEKASAIAREMVVRYGMSEKVGVVTVGDDEWARVGEGVRALVEEEVKRILEESHTRAIEMLKAHRQDLEKLAEALVEHETLTSDEVKAVIKGQQIRREA